MSIAFPKSGAEMPAELRLPLAAKVLHWLTAALVLGLFATGVTMKQYLNDNAAAQAVNGAFYSYFTEKEWNITPSPVNDGIVEMYKEQIRSLSRTNDVLREQINQLNTIVEVMQSQHESTVAVLSDQIDHLNAQLAMIQKEKDQIRDDLAMSRALEGFHFPWQRDRIVSRYLLPTGQQSEVMNESDAE